MKVPSNGEVVTKAGEIHRVLRDAILWGDLPPGSRLRTNILTEEYNVGLGSLREALTQLAAEGLAQFAAHRGYVVSPISAKDFADLSRVRTAIENLCLAWAIENGTLEWESNIVAATYRLLGLKPTTDKRHDRSAWAAVHLAFHAALVDGCGSPRLLQMRNHLYDQTERYRRLGRNSLPDDHNPEDGHRRLAESVIARDTPTAMRLMEEHINHSTAFIIEALSKPKPACAGAGPPSRRFANAT